MKWVKIFIIYIGVLCSSCSLLFDAEKITSESSDGGFFDARSKIDARRIVDATTFVDASALDAQSPDASPPMNITIAIPIVDSSGDMEEVVSSGAIRRTSLGLDFDTNSIVALRFPSIPIPQNSTIVVARIKFTAEQSDSGSALLILRADSRATSPPLSIGNNHISNRPLTSNSVEWLPPAWTALLNYRTPNLSSLIQPLVNQSTWSEGNALVFVIHTQSGARNAIPFDASSIYPDDVPTLEITYR